MKKRVAGILLIVVLLIIFFSFPVSKKTSISIVASFDNTMPQITNVYNWKNWYPSIKESFKNNPAGYSITENRSQKTYTINTPDKKYIILAITPMAFQVREVTGSWEDIFAFSVFSGDTLGRMKIIIEKKSPLFLAIIGKDKTGDVAINGLKIYLEDPKEFYGFNIGMSTIRDSVIASCVSKIRNQDVFLKIQELRLNLLNYIQTNNLIKAGHISISYIPISDDSLQLTVGIPVNKPAPSDKNINCLLLPAKGNVLVGNYEGKFSDRKKIYFSMTKYLTDHTLSIPAESFERYLNDSIPLSDSSMIRIELNYPVY
jgi:effector-binding domain-containing protein